MATPIPMFLPGEFHGEGILVDYSPWDLKELDTTERLTQHSHFCRASLVAQLVKNLPAMQETWV